MLPKILSYEPQVIADQIEHLDFLIASGKPQANPGGFLNAAISQGYNFPAGFKTTRQRLQEAQEKKKKAAERAEGRRLKLEAQEAQRAAEDEEQKRRDFKVRAYLETLSPEEIGKLEEEALPIPVKQPDLRKVMLYSHTWKILEEREPSLAEVCTGQ